MTYDPTIREQSYAYFLQEAPQLLQILEQELISLTQKWSINKVHNLMRATHTLKGAAASVGLESIKQVAHSLEDIFRKLCKPDINIDPETQALLFEGYECLRSPLMAELTGSQSDTTEIFDRTAAIFSRLQAKLGECFDQEAYIPTSTELGFDVIQSIFEVGVAERLEEITRVINTGQPLDVASTLQTQAEVFLGLAESLNLPGFGAIAATVLAALVNHPDKVATIAAAALADFQQGQAAVLAGDRTSGGSPSLILQELALEGVGVDLGDKEDKEDKVDLGDKEDKEEAYLTPTTVAPHTPLHTSSDSLLESIWTVSESQAVPVDDQFEVGLEPEVIADETDDYKQRQYSPPAPMPSKDTIKVSNTVRINVEHLDRLNYLIGELLTNQNRQSLQDEKLQGGIQELLSVLQKQQQLFEQLHKWLELLKLDCPREIRVLVQFLLENQEHLVEATDTVDSFARQSSQMQEKQSRLLCSARDEFLAARMVPLGNVFNRFPNVLQQLTTLDNKPAALKLSGTEVLVDKAVAEKLYDPLLHLVRNAFDHGIEPVEIRQQSGKPQIGEIEIRAFHQGSHLMIEVQDDGQGLDFERIRQKAVELDHVSPQQAVSLNEAQLMDLLFEPGFSTARQVSNLSGRGIGLDVVRAQIQALQGAITLYCVPQRGTTFLLQIPFSLTIAKLLLCQAGNTVYALLTDAIEQIILPNSEQLPPWQGEKVLRWGKGTNEELIPVYELSQLLNYFSPLTTPRHMPQLQEQEHANVGNLQMERIVLLRCRDKFLALEVDQIIEEQELVIRPLDSMIVPPSYVYGSTILADGQLALVIDGTALAKYVFDRRSNEAQRQLAQSVYANGASVSFTPSISSSYFQNQKLVSTPLAFKAKLSAKVLLVDDSLTLRQSLALTLQKYGYQVLQANDGYEAITLLRAQPDIQLVICDLEMPRMNGFEFLTHRRQYPDIAKIPVLVLTSNTREQNRLFAHELGAIAYMHKPYLEEELLVTVAEVTQ